MEKCKVLSWKYSSFSKPENAKIEILFAIQKNDMTYNLNISNVVTAFYGCDRMTVDLADTFIHDENNKVISLYNSKFLGWYIEKYRVREPIICKTPKDVLAIKDRICTEVNRTMLWSGALDPFTIQDKEGKPIIIDDYYGPEVNSWIARDSNKDTLNMLFDKVGIILPEYDNNDANSVECWETASQIWAENAQGEVGVSVGSTVSNTSMFAKKELNTLKANQSVLSIIVYDIWPINADGKKPKIYLRNEFEKMNPNEFIL